MNAHYTLAVAIADASRRPCPPVVPVRYVPCSDGHARSPFGIPHGVTVTGPGFIHHYAYKGERGTTYAPRMFATEDEAREHFEDVETRNVERFRVELLTMSPAELNRQAAYWLPTETA